MGHIGQVNREAFQFLVSDKDEEEDQADQRGDQEQESTEEAFGGAGTVHPVAALSRR